MDDAGRVRGGGYTPGWTPAATGFMARRTAATHAWAVLPLLRPGMDLLDAGCGPGTITAGLAAAVAPGRVLAVDREPGQAEAARRRLCAEGRDADALAADVADLPLQDGAVDVAFAHALLEHVPDPVAALAELARVVRPGGAVVAVSPDWGGFVLAPEEPAVARAIRFYERVQAENGGDVRAGRRLGGWMAAAGLADVGLEARYECHDDRTAIAAYLAERIARAPEVDGPAARGWAEGEDPAALAAALRDWARRPGGLFAQAWVAAVGRVSR